MSQYYHERKRSKIKHKDRLRAKKIADDDTGTSTYGKNDIGTNHNASYCEHCLKMNQSNSKEPATTTATATNEYYVSTVNDNTKPVHNNGHTHRRTTGIRNKEGFKI